jgi:hypothetical protein
MSGDPSPSRRGGLAYVQNILLGILPFILFAEFLSLLTFVPSATRGHSDFRQLYAAAHMIRAGHGHELYEYSAQKTFQDAFVSREEYVLPFLRPAYEALIFVPFSFLPYREAYFLFLTINLSLLVLVTRVLRHWTINLAQIWRWLPLLLFPTFIPVCVALMQGQDSIIFVALLAAAFVLLQQQRDLAAGVLVAMGLFKFQLVFPIAGLLLIWRRWRFCAGFVVSGAALALISLWITGPPETIAHVRSLLSVGAGVGPAPEQFRMPLRVSMMANLRGLFAGIAGNHFGARTITFSTIGASAIAFVSPAILLYRRRDRRDMLLIAITTSVLVSYYLFVHDLSVLLLPLMIVLDRFFGGELGSRRAEWLAVTALVCFIAPGVLFVSPSYFYLVSLPIAALLFLQIYIMPEQNTAASLDTGSG